MHHLLHTPIDNDKPSLLIILKRYCLSQVWCTSVILATQEAEAEVSLGKVEYLSQKQNTNKRDEGMVK
jgi:hypothetical protein